MDRVHDANTPMTVIDAPIARRNIERWQRACDESGTRVRPHVKGHKTLALARHQLTVGAPGLEVSRAKEVRALVEAGLRTDLVLSWVHDKPGVWDEAAILAAEGHRLTVDVDSLRLVQGYQRAAQHHQCRLGVRVQVDSGLRGCPPAQVERVCAAVLASGNLDLWGLTAYRSLYARDEGRDWTPFDVVGRREGQMLVDLRDAVMRSQGCHPLRVLCGSTAISRGAMSVDGVDEVAGGSYALNDWGLAQLGLCASTDIAVAVVVTVTEVSEDTVTINAGTDVFGRWDPYPGIARPVTAATPDGLITFRTVSHGHARSAPITDREVPRAGQRLIVHPGHVSELVNIPGAFTVIDDMNGDLIWPRLTSGYYSPDDALI